MADDMDDELLSVVGRKSAAKKRRAAEYDEDDEAPGGSKRGKTGAAGDADGDDDMDEAERQKLEAMNELEREMYLYEREEQRNAARMGKQLVDQARDQVRASSRRPRAQTGTDSAIGKIAAAHAQREAREKKKKKEEAEREEKQARARGRKRVTDDEDELPDDDEEGFSEEEESGSEGEHASDDAGLSALEEEEEEDDMQAGAAAGKAGARAEVFDEGTGYEEAEDLASLEEIHSIQLTRQRLEQWHNEPFFEADLPGLILRIVPNLGPNAQQQQRSQQPQYMLVRVEGVVQRNSYSFPKPPERTRKWLHLDDLTGTVFRHQMNMVSNGLITQDEYDRAKKRADRAGAKFITKGDVQQALEKLQHAHSFKYDQALVKEMLQKKRAAGKMTGGYAQTRARLTHELILAQQEGRSEDDIQRIREELDRLEQQQRARMEEEEELLAAAVEAEKAQEAMPTRVKPAMALALVNMRNRDKNAFKTLNAAPGSAVAKAAAATLDGSITADVFGRRHTVSKVYWSTKMKGKKGKEGEEGAEEDGDAAQEQQQQQRLRRLRRSSSSGAAEVEGLKGSLKKMDPSELIKVLDLSVDLSALPRAQQDLVPKRVLGPRWYQTLEKRQQAIVGGRHLISLQEWRQRCEQTRAL